MKKLSAFFFVVVFVSTASQVFALQYTVTPLGNLPGATGIKVESINDLGQVVGYFFNPGLGNGSFIWNNGVMSPLGLREAHSINNAGQVVGFLRDDLGWPLPALWENGVATQLGTLGGHTGIAIDINDSGQAVGLATGKALLWDNGAIIDLGGDEQAQAWAINNSGQVVGEAGLYHNTRNHACLWEDGEIIDLQTLSDPSEWWDTYSWAYAINDSGQVVGYSQVEAGSVPDTRLHAFLWEAGLMRDLGILGEDTSSTAWNINNLGQVVGIVSNTFGPGLGSNNLGFLWENGIMTDLNDLIDSSSGWEIHAAYDINNLGHIIAHGTLDGVSSHGLLLTPEAVPIPEPSTILLISTGLVGLVGLRRKFKRSS